jgi:hypothetical protein
MRERADGERVDDGVDIPRPAEEEAGTEGTDLSAAPSGQLPEA